MTIFIVLLFVALAVRIFLDTLQGSAHQDPHIQKVATLIGNTPSQEAIIIDEVLANTVHERKKTRT